MGITTTASRMTWSFARDNGLPASKFLSKVDSRTKVPVVACLVVTAIAALLTLIYIGSSVAFNDVISLTITGFYGSYLLPAILLLWHRIKGNILPHDAATDSPPPSNTKQLSTKEHHSLEELRRLCSDNEVCWEQYQTKPGGDGNDTVTLL